MNITSSLNVLLKSLALVGSITLLPAVSPFGFAGGATPRLPSKASAQVVNPKDAAKPGTPCCQITSVDSATGVVTAKVNSTGQSFQFKVADAALLNSLKTGQAVYASFNTQKVSVDGFQPCCQIVSLAKPGGVGAGAFQQDVGGAADPFNPCCAITGIDASGRVTAQDKTTGKTFQFKVADAALLNSLKTGQAVYANFKTQQASVDGLQPCCNIVSLAKGGGGAGAFQQDVGSAVNPGEPCCAITGIDASGRVTAQDKTTGKAFQFQVNDTNLLTSLHVGQSVSANFSTSQVAIAGFEPCCAIVGTGVTSHVGVTNTAGTSGSQAKPVSADDLPGIRMQIRELKHTTNSVTLRFTLFNDGNAPFAIGYNFGGWANIQNVRLIDPATNTSYSVALAGGCQCSENVHDVAPKSQVDLWAKFAVPPEVKLATVTIPHFTPVEDIPISKP